MGGAENNSGYRHKSISLSEPLYHYNQYMRILIVALTILLCSGFSCYKQEEIDISGYTKTDAIGNIMGSVDPTDWTHDTKWTDLEISVFNTIGTESLTGTTSGTISITPAFPNPCTDQFGIGIQSTSKCVVRMGIVNEGLDIKWQHYQVINIGVNYITIAPDPSKIGKGLYRLYYAFESFDQHMFYKGHGDVMFQ